MQLRKILLLLKCKVKQTNRFDRLSLLSLVAIIGLKPTVIGTNKKVCSMEKGFEKS